MVAAWIPVTRSGARRSDADVAPGIDQNLGMNCGYCHAELLGPYCHACGQKAIEEDALSARAIAAELWAHVPASDFKTLTSLRALVRGSRRQ